MEAFIEKFSRKYNLPAADCLRLIGLMERRVFRKGECVVRQGERNSDFYVVSRGIWLGHYLDDGADVSVWFAGEGEALFSTWGYVGNEVSKISIEAMCDAELYGISKADLEVFFAESAETANFGRRLFEKQFLALENWILSGGAPRAEERYRTLMEESPELLQYVPLKHIASYLWITPQSLSRIRAKLGKKKGCPVGQPFFSPSAGCHPPPRALYNPTSARCSLRTALLSSTCASKNFRWASSTSM